MQIDLPSLDDVIEDGDICLGKKGLPLSKYEVYRTLVSDNITVCLYMDDSKYLHLIFNLFGYNNKKYEV